MKTVTIYTDGACSGNPGPGGWGAILRYKDTEKELSGGAADTTNNRMELTAVIEALDILREPCVVELYSDSKYVIDGLSRGWAKGWQKRGWIKSDKKPALNPDLWEMLLGLVSQHRTTHDITNSINMRLIRTQIGIYLNKTSLVHIDTNLLQTQTLCVGYTTHTQQHSLCFQCFLLTIYTLF